MSKYPLLSSFVFGLIGLLSLSFMALSPKVNDKVVLIFSPFTNAQEAFVRVANNGGNILSFGNSGNFIIALFANTEARDIKAKTGAWLVLNANLVSACFRGE